MKTENGILISASILAADFRCLASQIISAEEAGVDVIHIDVMDGQFVPNISMGPLIVETCKKVTRLPLDVHLMIVHPEKYIDTFRSAGADKISIHVENNPVATTSLEKIRNLGAVAGLVLNPGTPASAAIPLLSEADRFLIMTVHPGFGGQKFMPEMLEKIRELSAQITALGLDKKIQVDGGINQETARLCYAAGARDFVAGNSLFNHPQGIRKGVEEIRRSIQ